MLAAIDRANGRDAVMRVMTDPRRLFSEYVKALSTDSTEISYRPDGALATRILGMGSGPKARQRHPRRR